MKQFTFKQAKRRYQNWFWPMMGIYTAACLGGAYLQRTLETTPDWLPLVMAVGTTLPIFGFPFFLWRYVQETDEFSRLMQLESLAIAGLVTVGAAGLIGFLQLYEAIPTFPVFLLLPCFFFAYGITKAVRGKGACV